MNNCGASGTDNCCASFSIPGGTFYRTYTYDDAGVVGGEADPATISAFRLDKYEVTVGRFRQFVDAVLPPGGGQGWMPAAGSGKHTHVNAGNGLVNVAASGVVYEPGWVAADNANVAPTNSNLQISSYTPGPCTWTSTAGTQENLPINCMTWAEAYAFCIWDGGGFMPSEAEWEYAAAGGSEQREFAWGETAPGVSYQYAVYDCYYPSLSSTCNGVGTLANIAPVGQAPLGVGKWGQLDMIGNMAEYNVDYVPNGSPMPYTTCTDCMFQQAGSTIRHSFRGGGYNYGAVKSTDRNSDWPARSFGLGFRCARTP
jgi:formylglycine-generating enzyme required for sulfatase activity